MNLHDVFMSGPKAVAEKLMSLWEKVQQEQVDMFAQLPPTNAFEEMIQWTKQGKLWQFPINNEQGACVRACVRLVGWICRMKEGYVLGGGGRYK